MILRLQQEVDFFREKFKLSQHKQFGTSSSERSPDQFDIWFNEAEATADAEPSATEALSSAEESICVDSNTEDTSADITATKKNWPQAITNRLTP